MDSAVQAIAAPSQPGTRRILAVSDIVEPQLYNARRYNVPIDNYPTLLRADENANALDAFAAAHPDRQKVPA